jgi:nucleoside 2-deoxyribosyltransferase
VKIYLASRYSRIDELNTYADDLLEAGHWVTSRWLEGYHHLSDEYQPKLAKKFATEDIADVEKADCLIIFPDPPRESSTTRGGMNVEFGYAFAAGKRVIIVGPRCNVFHYLPGIEHYAEWEQCLRRLSKVQPLSYADLGIVPHG